MPGVLLKRQELWVGYQTNARMVEMFLFGSKGSRPDKTSAQSAAVIWDEHVDWNTWVDGWKETIECAGKLKSQSDVMDPLPKTS